MTTGRSRIRERGAWQSAAPRAISLIVLATCVATLAGIALPASATAAACPDIALIGARGSGQNDAKQRRATKQLGYEVYDIARVLKSKAKADNLSMRMLGVPYEAASVDVLRPNAAAIYLLSIGNLAAFIPVYLETSLKPYLKSIQEGIDQLVGQVETWSANCPDVDLVLSGYSQGAIAVHQAMLALDGSAANDSVLGAIVLADGDRVPTTGAKRFGSAKRDSSGVRTYLRANDSRDFPEPDVVVEICDKQDIVCDFNASNVRSGNRAKKAAAVHTGYRKRGNGKLLRRAASWFYREMLDE